jgi:hypothetical protein
LPRLFKLKPLDANGCVRKADVIHSSIPIEERHMGGLPKILVVANKTWECDPLMGALLHEKVRPKSFERFKFYGHPFIKTDSREPNPEMPVQPRVTFQIKGAAEVQVWCIQDLMNPAESSSLTLEKARILPRIFQNVPDAAAVVAFGTAAIVDGERCNGSVVIGTRAFIVDAFDDVLSDERPDRKLWTSPHMEELLTSPTSEGWLKAVDTSLRAVAESRFLTAPIHPASPPLMLVGNGFTSLGIVNVVKYEDYVWADRKALETFTAICPKARIGSIETTHGLIRLQSEKPFFFVSGITDTDGLFDFEVTPREYGQNFVAAHNAGVATVALLEALASQLC